MQVYLNDNTSAAETVSLTVLPIYYLEPNVRVAIKDDESKINGEYIQKKYGLKPGIQFGNKLHEERIKYRKNRVLKEENK